jgi:dTDP-glucose 4,6-dehydratase
MMEMLVEISDVVINFADESNTLNMCATNCIGAQVLSELCAQSNKRLIHISNYSVYGGYSIHPSREEELLVPRTPHAASKVAADELVIGYSEGRDLQSIIVRLVTAYGPNEKPNTGVANIITSAILGKDITVPNGNYEFMYVQDQCAVIDKILHSNKKTRIYNIGSGFRCGMLEISHIVKKALQSNCDVNVERISHPVQHGVSSDRAVFELGKYPVTYLKDGLMRTINWYLSNKAWWKDMIKE